MEGVIIDHIVNLILVQNLKVVPPYFGSIILSNREHCFIFPDSSFFLSEIISVLSGNISMNKWHLCIAELQGQRESFRHSIDEGQ